MCPGRLFEIDRDTSPRDDGGSRNAALLRSRLTREKHGKPALAAEDLYLATCLTPNTGATIRRLAELEPRTLALMHGPSYAGDGAGMLRTLGDAYDERLRATL